MSYRRMLLGFGLTACVLIASGCASSRGDRSTDADERVQEQLMIEQSIPPEIARDVAVFQGGSGARMTWTELAGAAVAADVVLIGENHGHAVGLAAAAALFDDILAARPNAVLAMEFFERDEQAAVDDFLSGVTDEAAMLRATGKRTPEAYPPGHRAMILAAKRAGRPVIAANAPRRYVRLARTEGLGRLQSLDGEQRRLYDVPPEGALSGGDYQVRFNKIMLGDDDEDAQTLPTHPESPGSMGEAAVNAKVARAWAFFRSQIVWDWTMGTSVVRAAERGTPVVLVVGRFHVERRGGTVQTVELQSKGSLKPLVITFVDEPAPPGDVVPEADRDLGDVIVYVGPFPSSK